MRTNTKSPKKTAAKATKPATKATKPATKSTKPATKATKPATKATKPATKSTKPAGAKTKSAGAKAKPAGAKAKPAGAKAKPAGAKTKSTVAKAPKKTVAKTSKQVTAKAPKKTAAKSPKSSAARLHKDDPTSDAALLALPREYEASPDMPVRIAQAELTALLRMAQTVAGPLAKVGITRQHLDTLQRFAKRLGLVESHWQAARTGVTLSVADRKRLFEAEALDAKLVAGGRWACRKDREALDTLDRIAEGTGLADTIADLSDLVAFWADHRPELGNTDITARDLTRATELAAALELAADKETRDLDAAAAQALRNRCFWAADELAREVREGGRYAFRLQPKMAAKFASRYRLTINRRNRDKPPATPPAPSPART